MESEFSSRGYLLHRDVPGATQFITFRLADSLPQSIIEQYRRDRESADHAARKGAFRKVEDCLDTGTGDCTLAKPGVAKAFIDNLFKGQEQLYRVSSFCVMPNHVHLLLKLQQESKLGEAMKLIKGRSSRVINQLANRSGQLWQPDYFDRMIRDDIHFERAQHYTHWNPVKAGLAVAPDHYAHSSANSIYETGISSLSTEVECTDAD